MADKDSDQIIVMKFGGSSVADAQHIKNVAKIAISEKERGKSVVVVVSAMGKTTDGLIKLAAEVTDNPPVREIDMLLSTGEQVSIAMLAMTIEAMGYKAKSMTGWQVGIKTDAEHTRAKILNVRDKVMREELRDGNILIVAGFQGITEDGEITTLGRGGSDLTAVALAAALKADCDIYTDVDGVYTCDPRIVPNARKLDIISYDEMLELASLGAKVLHSRCVEVAKKFNVPLQVRSSFHPDVLGTKVIREVKEMEDIVVSGVAFNRNVAKISVLGVPDKPGIAANLFTVLGEAGIIIDLIIQNVSRDNINDISFTVSIDDLKRTMDVLEKFKNENSAARIVADNEVAKLSVVGVGMKSHANVAATMFQALAENNINIENIGTSEIKVSVLIREKDLDKAVRAIHEKFDLSEGH